MLTHKNIVIGITGSIAAYKTLELIRLLKKQGASVKVIMTQSAQSFITPLSCQAISEEPVHCDLLSYKEEAAMGHISLARWADLVVIAPASANIIAKLNVGLADDLLTTLCLATKAPILIAPAMNKYMWENQTTQSNIQSLKAKGYQIVGPAKGVQACGDIGWGRLLEPKIIIDHLYRTLSSPILAGTTCLITAGPTEEPIDTVRYISNYSSGKMGYALAQAAYHLGANVILVTGPTHLSPPPVHTILSVKTAKEMHQAVMSQIDACQLFISTAAVSDYTCKTPTTRKIKSDLQTLSLTLEKNPDILFEVCQLPKKPFTVGFAAETHDLLTYASKKLKSKGCDMIAANWVSSTQGFNQDHNALWVLGHNKAPIELSLDTKEVICYQLLEIIAENMQNLTENTQHKESLNT